MHNQQPLAESSHEVLRHIHRLWGFDILLESVMPDGTVSKVYNCPEILSVGEMEQLI
jgi:spore cortex formation protein SpoVR/YcgB (stage V sporulation)